MYVLFLDESGTPPKRGSDAPAYFVLGGAIIHEARWSGIRDALLGLKARRGLRGELKWRYFAPANEDAHNPMRLCDPAERNDIRREVYAILRQHAVVTLAAVCSGSAAYALPSVADQADIYHLAYKAVSERFHYFCQGARRRGETDAHGIIVIDHRGAHDDRRLRAYHETLVHASAEFNTRYAMLIESLFVQPSNLSIGIQLADMVAGAVWRRFERGDTQYYDEIEPTLRRSPTGVVDGHGLVKVPKFGWI